METFEWIKQLLPIWTLFPIKEFGWITVFKPIFEVSDIDLSQTLNELKWLDNLLKSENGSFEISKALPSGHSTFLFIKTTDAFDLSALS